MGTPAPGMLPVPPTLLAPASQLLPFSSRSLAPHPQQAHRAGSLESFKYQPIGYLSLEDCLSTSFTAGHVTAPQPHCISSSDFILFTAFIPL